jgi:AraC-like DNA-binding protein
MTDVPRTRNIVARQVLKELKQAGIAADPLLSEAGLQMYQLNREDGWLAHNNHAVFLEAAAREFADPYYGLNLAFRFDPRDFGALTYVGLSSSTLEDALINLERYISVLDEAWSIDLDMQGRTIALHLVATDPAFHLNRQEAEFGVGSIISAYQFFLAQPLVPQEVHLVHSLSAGRDKARIQELLGCPVQFSQNRTQIILDRKSLMLPIGTADDRLLKILTSHCEQVLKERGAAPSSLVTRVCRTITELLPSGRSGADGVASELGLARRTMHRRLSEHGVSFSQLHESLRRELANRYVNEKKLTFQQIAFLLGYADQSAFSVAFKRWNGHAPRDARAQALSR